MSETLPRWDGVSIETARDLLSEYADEIKRLQTQIDDLKAERMRLSDELHERGEMVRREQMLRSGEIRIVGPQRSLTYEDGSFIVRQEIRRGKMRGTWPPIFLSGDFGTAYRSFLRKE